MCMGVSVGSDSPTPGAAEKGAAPAAAATELRAVEAAVEPLPLSRVNE